jgi:hypothetical protein
VGGAGLDSLWVLLVANEGELPTEDADGRVPVMAKAGDNLTYLLVFKNVAKARQFVAAAAIEGAEPRMVVRGNRPEIIRICQAAGVSNMMLDFDPASGQYASASPLA